MPSRSRGAYDLTIDPGDGAPLLGFTLAREAGRPAVVPVDYGPGRMDEQVRNSDVPRVIDNLDAGMGYSRRIEAVPNGYAYCLPGYTRAPGGIFCSPGKVTEITMPAAGAWSPAAVVDSHAFKGNLYLVTQGVHVLKMTGGTGVPAAIATGAAGFAGQNGAIFNNRLYVSGSAGGLLWLDGTTGNWWQVPGVIRGKLAVANWRPLGIPTDFLIGVAPDMTIRYVPITADPTRDADWSAGVRIGADDVYGVNFIAEAPRHIYFLRPDGVYDMDEYGERAFNLTPWMREGRDQNNGLWGIHVGDGLYYGHSQGLAFVPTTGEAQHGPSWCQPGYGLPWEGPIRGQPIAGTLHDGWVGTAVYDGNGSYICWGTPSQAAYGRATHVWHGAEAYFPGERVTHLRVHTTSPISGWPHLLIASSVDGASPIEVKLRWQSLTKVGTPVQELLLGGAFEPADAASLFLPADPWGRASAVKTMLQFDLITERLTSSDYLALYAGADEGAYAEQGLATEGAYTSLAPLELTEGRWIKTRVDAVGSPLLRSLELRAALGVELREARVYRVVLAWDNGLRTPRGRDRGDPEQRMAELRAVMGRVVTLQDDSGSMRVRILQVMQAERRQLGGARRAGAWAMVAPILVSILDRPFTYDSAATYGGQGAWS